MLNRFRYLLGGALALAAAMLASQADATATVRVEWLKNGTVYSAENVTSSGASAASAVMPDMGGVAGQARIVPIAGAAVVMHGLTAPVATQTNGVRLQVGQDPLTMTVQPGEKVAIIEATDALAATPTSGSTTTTDAQALTDPGNVVSKSGATVSGGDISFTANAQAVVVDTQGYAGLSVLTGAGGNANVVVNWSNKATGPWTNGEVYVASNAGSPGEGSTITNTSTQYTTNVTGRYAQVLVTSFTSGPFVVTPVLHLQRYPARSVFVANTLAVQGSAASGATATPNPITIGMQSGSIVQAIATALNANGSSGTGVPSSGPLCKYNAALPTFTDGQYGNCQIGTRGSTHTELFDANGTTGANVDSAAADGKAGSQTGLVVNDRLMIYNGSTWDRWLSGNSLGASGASAGLGVVIAAPTSSQGQAIIPVVSTAVESNHVIKAAGANLYRIRITTGATAGFLLLFNATSAPADGAVTPQSCTVVPASSTVELDHPYPDRFTTGITAVFSTTGCFSKTASATAMFEGFAF